MGTVHTMRMFGLEHMCLVLLKPGWPHSFHSAHDLIPCSLSWYLHTIQQYITAWVTCLMLIILSPREKCVWSGRELRLFQTKLYTDTGEKSRAVPCIRRKNWQGVCWPLGKAIMGLRPATTRENHGSYTAELSLHCGKAICPAASMLHQLIHCDTWGTSKFSY